MHGIQRLIDVRTVPRSRHNLRFNTEALATSLANEDISYRRTACLGALKQPRKDSINRGWRNDSFRSYADCMQQAFASVLEELMADSQELRTAIMYAEAASLRCHRPLIADALATRDWQVRHILSEAKADRHQLTSFAILENGLFRYPDQNTHPQLFP